MLPVGLLMEMLMEMEMEESGETRKDRITELPADIKQRILSFLSTREAIATSTLSSLWRYTYVSLPSLDLGYSLYEQFSTYFDTLPKTHPKRHHLCDSLDDYITTDDDDDGWYDCETDDDNESMGNYDEYCFKRELKHLAYVQWLDILLQIYRDKSENQVLKNLSIHVPKLSKYSKIRAYASDVASQWLSLCKDSVQELSCTGDVLSYRVEELSYTIEGSWSVLQSKTLAKLVVEQCSLIYEGAVVPIDLPCLKQLHLISSNVERKMLDALLLGSYRALEVLEFHNCQGVRVLRIPSQLSKLKEIEVLHIDDLDLVEINAMSVQSLTLIGLKGNKCKVKVPTNSFKNLVELLVNGVGITDDFLDHVAVSSYLKTLSLIDCPKLKHIKIKSNSLEKVCFGENPNLGEIELDAPKLQNLAYRNTINQNIVTLLSTASPVFAQLRLKFPCDATLLDQNLWHSKLVALLTNFNHSKDVHLAMNSKKSVIISQALRDSLSPPLCGVQYVRLTVPTSFKRGASIRYLDTLLWLSPCPMKIWLSSEDMNSHLSIELQYEEKIMEGESCGGCPTKPSNRCSHVLKDIQILHQRGLGGAASMRKLLEGALKKSKATACRS